MHRTCTHAHIQNVRKRPWEDSRVHFVPHGLRLRCSFKKCCTDEGGLSLAARQKRAVCTCTRWVSWAREIHESVVHCRLKQEGVTPCLMFCTPKATFIGHGVARPIRGRWGSFTFVFCGDPRRRLYRCLAPCRCCPYRYRYQRRCPWPIGSFGALGQPCVAQGFPCHFRHR